MTKVNPTKITPTKISNAIQRASETGDLVICDLSRPQQFYSISGWAAVTWELIDGKKSVEDLAQIVAKDSGISVPRARKEIIKLCKDLAKAQLVIL